MTPVPAEVEKNTKSAAAVSRDPFVVPGFLASAAASGMRYKDRLDLALIATESPDGGTAAGVFTLNRVCAAPVLLCRENLQAKRSRAILANAGYANASTGEEGLRRARAMAGMAAEALGASPGGVFVASTGVIGPQVILEPVEQAMPQLKAGLRPDGWADAARAIMTTDLVPKFASTQVTIGGKPVTIGGICKGSGMIAPNMATLLAFVCTDAVIEREALDYWLRRGADASFNAITVDGDTSTNDTLLVLASGRAGNEPIADPESEAGRAFGAALGAVLLDMAKQIVLDGEGATKFITIEVSGAPDVASAKTIAFTIAHSPLVKTAFFGEDANWGRIVAAAGRSGVPITPERVTLFFDQVCVFREGAPVADVEDPASEVFRRKEIPVRLDVGMGDARFTAYTCDLSFDYIKINASYRS